MDSLIIQGGVPLNGEITASGNKNAALKLLPACLMTEEPIVLHNMPDIADVRATMDIMSQLGVNIEALGAGSWRFHAKTVASHQIDRVLGSKIRSSIVFAGPMLARMGRLELPPPGGDVIGRRRVDTHFLALKALGTEYEVGETYSFKTPHGLKGADILLDEASVTATENTIIDRKSVV